MSKDLVDIINQEIKIYEMIERRVIGINPNNLNDNNAISKANEIYKKVHSRFFDVMIQEEPGKWVDKKIEGEPGRWIDKL